MSTITEAGPLRLVRPDEAASDVCERISAAKGAIDHLMAGLPAGDDLRAACEAVSSCFGDPRLYDEYRTGV